MDVSEHVIQQLCDITEERVHAEQMVSGTLKITNEVRQGRIFFYMIFYIYNREHIVTRRVVKNWNIIYIPIKHQ